MNGLGPIGSGPLGSGPFRNVPKDEAILPDAEDKSQAAIEQMVKWFRKNFEHPGNELFYDKEDGDYVYLFGGPFRAGDVLFEQFGDTFSEADIIKSVDTVESDGTQDWAPTSQGEYYDNPPDEGEEPPPEIISSLGGFNVTGNVETIPTDSVRDVVGRIRATLVDIEKQLDELPTFSSQIGDNYPPEDIGIPPYRDEDRDAIRAETAKIKKALEVDQPDENILFASVSTIEKRASPLKDWLFKKGDIFADELIKEGVKAGFNIIKLSLLLDGLTKLSELITNYYHMVTY